MEIQFKGGEADDLIRILRWHGCEFGFSKPTTAGQGGDAALELMHLQWLMNGQEFHEKK
jgi:hypothetical protein